MGNYRFRLSDMIPNAWFYKLKDMGKITSRGQANPTKNKNKQKTSSCSSSNLESENKKTQPHQHFYQRKSYYISRNLSPASNYQETTTFSNKPKVCEDVPFQKSSKKRRSTTRRSRSSPKLVTSSVSASCSCRASLESVWTIPDSEYPNSHSSSPSSHEQESILPGEPLDPTISPSASCGCRANNGDIIIDVKGKDSVNYNFQSVPKIDLPPIITKPQKFNGSTKDIEKKDEKQRILKEEQRMRRVSVSSTTGLKVRTVVSPNNRRIQASRKSVSSRRRRRSVSESFAVVKSSEDPVKDFRESMVEMIVENNIRASKDLEELLACYLSLNSDEYHHLIINVFKQIWFDIK